MFQPTKDLNRLYCQYILIFHDLAIYFSLFITFGYCSEFLNLNLGMSDPVDQIDQALHVCALFLHSYIDSMKLYQP